MHARREYSFSLIYILTKASSNRGANIRSTVAAAEKNFSAVDNFLRNYKDAHTGIRIMPFIKAFPTGDQ